MFERNSNVDEGSSSIRALPKLVTGRIFMYLTDMHVRRVIMANGSDGEQLFDNMRVSRDYYDSIPKCWECWSKNQTHCIYGGGLSDYFVASRLVIDRPGNSVGRPLRGS